MLDNPKTIIIENEDDAFRFLEQSLKQELGANALEIEFRNWPVITIALNGAGYNSTITSQMAGSLVELQHALNRTYARAAHSSANPNTLTNAEKRDIQFKAKIRKGSSIIEINLGDFAEKLATTLGGKMDGTEMVVTVIGTALVGAGFLAYKAYLRHQTEDKKAALATQERLTLSQEETKRQSLLLQAMTRAPSVAHASSDFDDVRHEIVKSVSDATSITLQGLKLTNEEARVVALTPRTKAIDAQLNGHYLIQRIDWSRPGDARLSLFSMDETLEFSALLDTALISPEQKEMLKSSEWDRKKLHMTINATKLRGEITAARIINVEWPKADSSKTAS